MGILKLPCFASFRLLRIPRGLHGTANSSNVGQDVQEQDETGMIYMTLNMLFPYQPQAT